MTYKVQICIWEYCLRFRYKWLAQWIKELRKNRRLEYRMVQMNLNKVREEYELTHGFCDCACGESKRWEVCESYGGDEYISVGRF